MTRECSYSDPRRPQLQHCTECGADLSLCVCPPERLSMMADHRVHSLPGIYLREVYMELKTTAHDKSSRLSGLSVLVGKLHEAYLQGKPVPEINVILVKTAALAIVLAVENREDMLEPRAL